jgi:hypothetical protein
MATTNVDDLTNVGDIADGDILVGERVSGTTVTINFNNVLQDGEFSSNGVMTRTASGTYANRTITGTADKITVTNGDGVSGDPTLTIASTYVGQTSITTLGTIATGTWEGTTVAVDQGGTGQTSYTDGQLLIGNSTGNTLAKATLSGTSDEITVSNGSGSITLGVASTYAGGSSIATVGTITTGTWQGTTIAVDQGGTGQTSYTDGQLLIGNSTGNTLAKATLSEGEAIDITNGSGTITIAAEDASTTNKGVAELATTAEVTTGTDTGRVITPSALPVQIQDSKYVYAADAEASDTYVISLTPAPSAYAAGQVFHFKANTANTGAATLNVNSLGATTIVKEYNATLEDNDIKAGQIVTVVYDGTNFQMQSQLGNAPGDMVLSGTQSVTGAKTFDSGTLIYAGATSGTTTVNATAVAGTTTLTLPAATDTLVGKATTDTFTNKTFDANGTGNSLSNVDVADLANGTDGELITWDASGNPATVGVGTSGHILTSNGAGAAPTFQANTATTGTFTPTLFESGSEVSDAAYNSSFTGGTYMSVGDVVTFTMSFRLTSKGTVTSTNTMQIGDLPFTSGSSASDRGAVAVYVHGGVDTSGNKTGYLQGLITGSANYITFEAWDSADDSAEVIQFADVTDSLYIQITGTFVKA